MAIAPIANSGHHLYCNDAWKGEETTYCDHGKDMGEYRNSTQ